MFKKITLAILLISCIQIINSQSTPIGLELNVGGGYNFLNPKTANYINNSIGFAFEANICIGNYFIGLTSISAKGYYKDSLLIRDNKLYKNEKLTLGLATIVIGYKHYTEEKNTSIAPYIGIVKTGFYDYDPAEALYDSRIGYCCGLSVNRYFNTNFKYIEPYVFINTRLNYTRIKEINDKLGNFIYSFKIGVGFYWGENRSNALKRY